MGERECSSTHFSIGTGWRYWRAAHNGVVTCCEMARIHLNIRLVVPYSRAGLPGKAKNLLPHVVIEPLPFCCSSSSLASTLIGMSRPRGQSFDFQGVAVKFTVRRSGSIKGGARGSVQTGGYSLPHRSTQTVPVVAVPILQARIKERIRYYRSPSEGVDRLQQLPNCYPPHSVHILHRLSTEVK